MFSLVMACFFSLVACGSDKPAAVAPTKPEETSEAVVEASGEQATPEIVFLELGRDPADIIFIKGITDGLVSQGLVESKNLSVLQKSAAGRLDLLDGIAQNIAASKPTLIIPIGGLAFNSAAKASTSVPVVYAGLYSEPPEQVNVTGVTSPPEVSTLIAVIKKSVPGIRKLGVIYHAENPDALFTIQRANESAAGASIKLLQVSVVNVASVEKAARKLIANGADAILIPGDKTTAHAIKRLTEICDQKRIPLFSTEADHVQYGAVSAVGLSKYHVGKEVGLICAQIIRGRQPAHIPRVTFTKTRTKTNLKKAKKLKLNVAKSVLKQNAPGGH